MPAVNSKKKSTTRSPERQALVGAHLRMVAGIATEIYSSLGLARALAPRADLIGYGHVGLLEAADRFDPTRSVSFSSFAYPRIRGAIFDGIRKMHWQSRPEAAGAPVMLNEQQLCEALPDRSSLDADEMIDARRVHQAVVDAVRALPPNERTLIERCYLRTESPVFRRVFRQEGAKLGRRRDKTLHTHLRAIEQLREALPNELRHAFKEIEQLAA